MGHKIIMPQRDDPRHNLRLPPELKAKLGHAAIDNGRSMNAEILARLEQTFAPDATSQIVDILRATPNLTDNERLTLGKLLVTAGAILTKGRP